MSTTQDVQTSADAPALSLWPEHPGVLRFTLDYPEQSPSNNELREVHFHQYRRLRRHWHLLTLAALRYRQPATPLTRALLVIERRCAGMLDWDNALGGLKPLLDCLVAPTIRNPDGLGLVLDDSPRCLPFPPFMRQLPAAPSKGSTRIFIYELPAPDAH